jgi:hypothetical protein
MKRPQEEEQGSFMNPIGYYYRLRVKHKKEKK